MDRYPASPAPIYAWDVEAAGTGWSGVTDNCDRACRQVDEALRAADACPSAHGTVRRVELDIVGGPDYIGARSIGRARLDADTGAVVWNDETRA
ncbi:hypothetical protein [Actinomadura litoris]|uniref:Uncharacterized protein n=1 Tax=Actinomadura litoris TaxID=2678616 RepID=A0A7K1LAN0_9ACTN|nr:hypothetical protein [Actinomadura litoris]MUN41373.1 hypothetical protein [Actinomadura litoris]